MFWTRWCCTPVNSCRPPIDAVESEFNRAHDVYCQLNSEDALRLISTEDKLPGSQEALSAMLTGLGVENVNVDGYLRSAPAPVDNFDDEARQKRQFTQLVNLTQRFLREAASRRKQFFWDKTDTSSLDRWEKTCADAKTYFWDEVIGRCPPPDVPANPKTRLVYDEPRWKGYEVVLDVWKDVFAYGILLLPNDLQPGEQRPVVVCQHGLEGRPQDTADPRIESVYHSYAAQLADRGFITYAPQNPYIGQDAFRVIQRKANPIKWSIFSLIVRQHERTIDWLAEQPFVDAHRIGFYGYLTVVRRRCACRHSLIGTPVQSVPRISTNGLLKTRPAIRSIVICSQASMRCRSSIWAIHSTMARWQD